MRAQIWPCGKRVKGQNTTIIWTNLVDLEYPMLYTKIQFQSFLGSGEEDLKVFFTKYMGMAAILFNDAEPFEQIVNTLSTEGPLRNLVKIAQAVSENLIVCWGLMTCKSLWVILCCLPEKGRKEIEEGMKERDREERGTGMKVNKKKK